MKKTRHLLNFALAFSLLFVAIPNANGQFLKKLGKKAEKAAERTVERRVETETSKKTDQVLDSILEPGTQGKQPTNKDGDPVPNSGDPEGNKEPSSNEGNSPEASGDNPKNITVYSKFDFVPGDKLLFFDDFANDFIGDFPAKWNTNGTGEVVTVGDNSQRWLKLVPGWSTYYIPDAPSLPKDYTIEFDLLTVGLDNKTSSTAGMGVTLSSDQKFKTGDYYADVWIPLGQFGAFDIRVKNYAKGQRDINNAIRGDIRQAILNQPHISIAVNDKRFRLWVNEKKYVDIPRFIPEGGALSTVKFNVNGLRDGQDQIFISNLKVAEGGVDLRRKLMAEGRISTNAILFDSGSANLQPQSMGVIRQISQVLQQDANIRLNIIGHTDSDGDDSANMTLSKKRADAVKNALVNVYNVSSDRLSTEGKGETEAVADNGTADGKAQNRRVEFVKI